LQNLVVIAFGFGLGLFAAIFISGHVSGGHYNPAVTIAAVADKRLSELVIAYEPVWAIGTGRTATPEQAEDAIGLIRSLLAARSEDAGAAVRILYGGSVTPENASELLGRSQIDGALVGGASLDPDGFASIVSAARP